MSFSLLREMEEGAWQQQQAIVRTEAARNKRAVGGRGEGSRIYSARQAGGARSIAVQQMANEARRQAAK